MVDHLMVVHYSGMLLSHFKGQGSTFWFPLCNCWPNKEERGWEVKSFDNHTLQGLASTLARTRSPPWLLMRLFSSFVVLRGLHIASHLHGLKYCALLFDLSVTNHSIEELMKNDIDTPSLWAVASPSRNTTRFFPSWFVRVHRATDTCLSMSACHWWLVPGLERYFKPCLFIYLVRFLDLK